ncbi:hypothetical protein ACFQL7_27745 [Halocatena marina]|uniref:Uncharacterized protein n=1 Tax=Halocatena marina TaxID=2934937 RepID=A0ABD5YV49_9EURY
MAQTIDRSELKSDLHGEQVGEEPICDFCDTPIEIEGPVMYDTLRVMDMPNLQRLFNPPSGWVPDTLRCQECEIDTLEPATKGLDEACVIVHLNESNGIFSIDASSITIADGSPHDEGYYPPVVNPMLMSDTGDLGLARWIRVQWFVNHSHHPLTDSIWKEMVEQSKDVPPDL